MWSAQLSLSTEEGLTNSLAGGADGQTDDGSGVCLEGLFSSFNSCVLFLPLLPPLLLKLIFNYISDT